MAKLYIGDHLGSHKTTIQMEKWFNKKGHEVHWDMYYENEKGPTPDTNWMEWADVVFFEWCEGMVALALKDGWGKKKPVYCRAMDIEIWAGQAASEDLTDLAGIAYTSKALFKILKEDGDWAARYKELPKAHIPLSVDMNDWNYRERKQGYNVAVIGHMWDAKGANLIPHFVDRLIKETGTRKWRFYIQGDWRHDVWRWYLHYTKHIIKEMGLEENIIINEDRIENMDQWLDDKNYLVTFSMKDAFSIIVAEAMAKGIKAIPHNFLGAKDIWGDHVWTTFDDLITKMVSERYMSPEYHGYVRDSYSNEVIMPKWERFLKI
jgi:glycosyltransferase involved in cell wall biosynthesis